MASPEQIEIPAQGVSLAPLELSGSDVSLVVPVRDDSEAVFSLLSRVSDLHDAWGGLREIVVVDNNSEPPLQLDTEEYGVPVTLLRCERPGPGSARNDGARHATGSWLLFMDSDSEPTDGLLRGFEQVLDGSLAYAGHVHLTGHSWIPAFCRAQRAHDPAIEDGRPLYIVTANALVWKPAFDQVGGFDERFTIAAGEDVDLGRRIATLGSLGYAPDAVVRHESCESLLELWKRYVRYGRGESLLHEKHGGDQPPRYPLKVPSPWRASHWIAAVIQKLALRRGLRLGL